MKLYELLFPPKCIVCGTLLRLGVEDMPFCELCLAKWEIEKRRAYEAYRGQPVRTYTDGIPPTERYGHVMFCVYYHPKHRQNVESRLILRLKDLGERRSVAFAASELAAAVRNSAPLIAEGGSKHDETVVTWIPRRRSSIKKYGFDHMERVAKQTAKLLSLPLKPLLCRRGFTFEQKHLDAKSRVLNAYSAMTVSKGAEVDGKTVLLIDDIVTTGASLDAAASMLIEAGAEQVIAAVLASSDRPLDEVYRIENGFNIIKKPKK